MEIDFLQNTILFKNLTEGEIKTALSELHGTQKKFRKHQKILRSGKTTESVGVVLSGSVTIESCDMWGNRTILSHVGAGDFFAETYALLKDEPLLVDVVANEPSEILFLSVGNLTYGDPWQAKLTRNLLMISSRKNLMLSGRSFHTSPKTVRGRIQAYLNSVSLQKGSRTFDIPFDRQQMADYLNLDRTALSKELGRMKKEGLIDFWKNHFKIINKN